MFIAECLARTFLLNFVFVQNKGKNKNCNFVVLQFRDALNQTRSILERRMRKIMGENKGSTGFWAAIC